MLLTSVGFPLVSIEKDGLNLLGHVNRQGRDKRGIELRFTGAHSYNNFKNKEKTTTKQQIKWITEIYFFF